MLNPAVEVSCWCCQDFRRWNEHHGEHIMQQLRKQVPFPIHWVFVSPFLHCLQTAVEAVSAPCAVDKKSDDPYDLSSNAVAIDPSKIKLCLMVRDMEIRNDALNALGKIPTVSEDILLQTLSKKALPTTKQKSYPG